ncbi:MAG: hypothetical protein Q4G63_09130 [Bacteroidia bacterium]|nr:hypothetical protein [Bacteroidia bacterium]
MFLLLIIIFSLNSCSENELLLSESINKPRKELVSKDVKSVILSFADEIAAYNPQKSFLRSDIPVEGKAKRKYVSGLGDCYNVSGNCLDDVIVTPSLDRVLSPDITNAKKLESWYESEIGELLDKKVAENKLTFSYTQNENGIFLQYSNIYDSNMNMVIPLK